MIGQRPSLREMAVRVFDKDHQTDRQASRTLLSRLRHREDSEHEQILIRLGLGLLALIYVVAATDYAGEELLHAWLGLGIVGGHFLGAVILLAHLLMAPGINVIRRCLGMVLDITAITLILLWGSEGTALFYPFYLWVTLGMGFRYGQPYLIASGLLTATGFALVILFTASWQEHLPLTLSLWVALLVLPGYAISLLNKLKQALDRAEEANLAKSRFLATMSHELRTPLHAIIGMTELLETRRLNTEQRQMVETVHGAGHTLLEMIEDILDVARIESGRLVKHEDAFDLHMVMKAIRCLLYRQARNKGIDLKLEIDPDLHFNLHGASRWVKQILINLVGNAIKFTNEGRVIIRASSVPLGPDRISLRIEVEDTGIGIDDEAIERIFDQFVQADVSATRYFGGTGLGLSIARQFAERMGGSLTVKSDIGKGACFRFEAPFQLTPSAETSRLQGRVVVLGDTDGRYSRLLATWGIDPVLAESWLDVMGILDGEIPLRALLLIDPRVDHEHQRFDAMALHHGYVEPIDIIAVGGSSLPDHWPCLAHLASDHDPDALYRSLHCALAVPSIISGRQPRIEGGQYQKRRILVAEDNRVNQRVIQQMLRIGGHSVTIVSNGELLLDHLDEHDQAFDLVLVDLNMPVMNGLDALKLHRIASGTDDHPPFVALTADATGESRERCLEAGMAGYLTKPVDLHELLSLIEHLTALDGATVDRRPSEQNVVRHPRFTAPRQILDLTHIERLRDLGQDDDFLSDVVVDFIEDADMLIDELEQAAMAFDSLAFRDRAHALRSSAAHLGATGIRDLCLTWRDFGPNDLQSRGKQEMVLLRAEFDRLRTALTALVTDEQSAGGDRPI